MDWIYSDLVIMCYNDILCCHFRCLGGRVSYNVLYVLYISCIYSWLFLAQIVNLYHHYIYLYTFFSKLQFQRVCTWYYFILMLNKESQVSYIFDFIIYLVASLFIINKCFSLNLNHFSRKINEYVIEAVFSHTLCATIIHY